MRPGRNRYFMDIAEATAARSTCPKASVGAVLVLDNDIIGTGYNGAPKGRPHCSEEECKEIDGHCSRVIHAEVNAILRGMKRGSVTGGTLYTTVAPCWECAKVIINVGISCVVYSKPYEDNRGHALNTMLVAGIGIIFLSEAG